jgi:hypothetical protein
MAFLPDQHFSTFSMGGDLELGDIVVGLRGGINTQFTWSNPAGVDTLQGTANQILVNGSTGVPVTGPVTLTAPQNLDIHSAFQVNTLQLNNASGLLGPDGDIVLAVNGGGVGGVNYIGVTNSVTGLNPNIFTGGTDANIGLSIKTTGNAGITFQAAATGPVIGINSGTSYQHQTLFDFPNTAASQTVTFPDASGTIAFTSSINTPVAASTTPIAVAMQTTYIVTDASTVTFNLPATIAFGQTLSIQGLGAGGWIIQANTGQNIIVGAQTSTTAGTVSSTNANDSINLICTVANTTLSALGGPQGNLTYA